MKTEEKIKQIEKLLDEVKAEREKKPEFKVGDWIYTNYPYLSAPIAKIGRICGNNLYINNSPGYWNINKCRHATPEEIKDVLVKEAKKRGFVNGLKLKRIISTTGTGDFAGEIGPDKWKYFPEHDGLYVLGVCIYENDRWAEIIEEQKKPEFKVGDWVKVVSFNEFVPVGTIDRIKSINNYGLRLDNTEGYVLFHRAIHATEKEIKDALEKELIKRGFVKGAKIKDLCGRGKCILTGGNLTDFDTKDGYRKGSNYIVEQFWMKSNSKDHIVCVYKDGTFAEIIEDNTIQIGNYDVKIYADIIKVGCHVVDFSIIKRIYKEMKNLRKI